MNRCLRTAALLSAVMLICTACTDGSWLDGTRLSFNTRGIDSVLATEDRANSSLPEMVSRDQEVVAVLDVDTPAVDGARAAYSAGRQAGRGAFKRTRAGASRIMISPGSPTSPMGRPADSPRK
jgi:hypothetical protein